MQLSIFFGGINMKKIREKFREKFLQTDILNSAVSRKVLAAGIAGAVLVLMFWTGPVLAEVQINAGYLDYAEDWVELEEGVEIFWEEYETVSLRGEIDREASIVYLYEEVELFFEGGFINAEEADMFLDDDEFVFRDDVYLNYDQGEEASPIEITTTVMTYYPEEENFVFEEELEIQQEGRVIQAGSGDFQEAEEAFYFADGVEIIEEGGDRITSQEAVLSMGEDEVFTAEGDVEIELEI